MEYKQQRQQRCSKAAKNVAPKVIWPTQPLGILISQGLYPGHVQTTISVWNRHASLNLFCVSLFGINHPIMLTIKPLLVDVSQSQKQNRLRLPKRAGTCALFFPLGGGRCLAGLVPGIASQFRPWRSEAKKESKHTEAFLHRPAR